MKRLIIIIFIVTCSLLFAEEIPEKPKTIPVQAVWQHKRWAYLDYSNGYMYSWYKDGVLERKGAVINNKPSGTWEYWGWDGVKMMDEVYENGELVKKINYKIYFPDSQKPQNIPVEAKWDQKLKVWSYHDKKKEKLYAWYINGEKKYLSSASSSGVINGSIIMWYQNGSIEREEYYINRIAQGLHKKYNKNGGLIEENYYKDGDLIWTNDYTKKPPAGLPEGVAWNKQWKGWKYTKNNKVYILYDSGNTNCEVDIRGLDFHGKFIKWQDGGSIILEGNYVNSKKEGTWIMYNKSGTKVHCEYYYKNNKNIGQTILADFNS